jgi:hypothetical protein
MSDYSQEEIVENPLETEQSETENEFSPCSSDDFNYIKNDKLMKTTVNDVVQKVFTSKTSKYCPRGVTKPSEFLLDMNVFDRSDIFCDNNGSYNNYKVKKVLLRDLLMKKIALILKNARLKMIKSFII